ncbi:MAG: hypothetical protein J6C82_01385 [Clostridia bacterium]|nr:hypothetical protein [Clostridia bacterium]
MKENISDKLTRMLSGVDGNKLKISADAVSKLLATPEGQRFKNSLSESDKKALIEKFMSLDANEVSEKLKNADMSKLGNMSAEDIMKKLR